MILQGIIIDWKDRAAINQCGKAGGGVGLQQEAQAFCLGCVIRHITFQTSIRHPTGESEWAT